MPEGCEFCWMSWTGSSSFFLFLFLFFLNQSCLSPCKDTHISPHQNNNRKLMPKAGAIASRVAIVKTLSDLSLPLCTLLKHTGNRIVFKFCSLYLNFLEAKLTYLSLIRCSCSDHTVLSISGSIWELSSQCPNIYLLVLLRSEFNNYWDISEQIWTTLKVPGNFHGNSRKLERKRTCYCFQWKKGCSIVTFLNTR